MYAPSKAKTCTLQVKQKHHVHSKWSKNIMYCFCFTWSVHDVFVSLGAYMMFLFHLEHTWCFCFTWSVHDVKTSCTLQVKQKHHVRSKWSKNIMYAPSETKTSCTLHVKQKHHALHDVFVSLEAYMFLLYLERTWCFCFIWNVHDVFVTWCLCFTWSVHDVFA
jgi:hypothetical protein